MAARYSLPSSINVNVADDVAIREGEQAAARIVRGKSLSDQLKIGVALMVLRRAAQKESRSNAAWGRAYNEAFSRQLALHPKLEAVYGHTRADALWCVENWSDVQAYLAKLEKDEPAKLQLLGVRGLRKLIEAEINATNRANEMPEPREPQPPRRTDGDRLNDVLLAVRSAGLVFDSESLMLVPGDMQSFRGWLKYLKDRAGEIAKLDDIEDKAAPADDKPEGEPF